MDLRNWNKMQIAEALADDNRYLFWLKYKRDPINSNELMRFYIEEGEAYRFAKKHKKERSNK